MSLHDVQIRRANMIIQKAPIPRRLRIALIIMAGAVLAVAVLPGFTVALLFSIPALAS